MNFFFQISPPGLPVFPQKATYQPHPLTLKMHKWQGETPKIVVHYALCNFDDKTHWPGPVPTQTLCIFGNMHFHHMHYYDFYCTHKQGFVSGGIIPPALFEIIQLKAHWAMLLRVGTLTVPPPERIAKNSPQPSHLIARLSNDGS